MRAEVEEGGAQGRIDVVGALYRDAHFIEVGGVADGGDLGKAGFGDKLAEVEAAGVELVRGVDFATRPSFRFSKNSSRTVSRDVRWPGCA